MSPALRALLAGIVDYAGLFPPAKLPFEEALRNYARYRQGPDAWMLGRFVCPAARLEELAALPGAFGDGPPLACAALGRGGATCGDFLSCLETDLRDIAAFRAAQAGRVAVDVLELCLPAGETPTTLPDLLAGMAVLPEVQGLSVFFEVPGGPRWYETLPDILRQLSRARLARTGFKLRCGGPDADAFPPASKVAFALAACRAAGVPFKATAGLHHPFPRFDANVQARTHGFINLFSAGVLARVHDLDAARIQAILEDADPGHFTFADGLRWGSLGASLAQVESARREAVLSFGSCSFDEPRDDLRALGWL
jgi:hypothetical protein